MENQALRDNRFSKTNPPKPHTQKHPNGYLTCKFKKWIKKNIYPYHNPVTGLTELIKGVDGIALATIWAALQGDMRATEILLERLEGKSVQKIEGLGEGTKIIIIRNENNPEVLARQIPIQQDEASGPLVVLGDRQNNVSNLAGNVIQRGDTQ